QCYATSFTSAWQFFARMFAGPAQGKFRRAVLSGRGSTAGTAISGVSRQEKENAQDAGEDHIVLFSLPERSKLARLFSFRPGARLLVCSLFASSAAPSA